MRSSFDPNSFDLEVHVYQDIWVNYRGKVLQLPFLVPRAEDVAVNATFDFENLTFRQPESFIAGNLHRHLDAWRELNPSSEVLEWLENGVDIENYFRHFKGDFKGKSYDSERPPIGYFENAPIRMNHDEFIKSTLYDRVRNGSMSVWGKVGQCDPTHWLMHLTIEETKSRLCHDERFF